MYTTFNEKNIVYILIKNTCKCVPFDVQIMYNDIKLTLLMKILLYVCYLFKRFMVG